MMFIRIAPLLALLIFSCPLFAEKFVITIDNLVKNFDENSETCDLAAWGNSAENRCLCCLLKKAKEVVAGKQDAQKLIMDCIATGMCNPTTLTSLGLQKDNYKDFINSVYERVKVIKKIDVKKILLDDSGFLRENSVADFLEQAYNEGKLPIPAFKDKTCLKIKELSEEKKQAKWATNQLFLISSKCPGSTESNFILKGIVGDPIDEIYRLTVAAKAKALAPLVYPSKSKEYPQFIFPLAYLSYDYKNENRSLALLPVAPGIQLSSFLQEFKKNPTDRSLIKNITQAYFDLGASLAHFYNAFKNEGLVLVHRDLHGGNIFWDPTDHRITLIDNERLSNATNAFEDICTEVSYVLMRTLFLMHDADPQFLTGFKTKEWYELHVPNFIAGFVSAYPKDKRATVYDSLVSCLKNFNAKESEYTNKGVLNGNSHQDFMEPIFNKLSTSKIIFEIDPKTINAKDKNGQTLMHQAVTAGDKLLLHPILAAGAQHDITDKSGNTPLTIAQQKQDLDIANILSAAVLPLAPKISPTFSKKPISLQESSLHPVWYSMNIMKPLTRKDKVDQYRVICDQLGATENTKIPANNPNICRIATYNVHFWKNPYDSWGSKNIKDFQNMFKVIKMINPDILILQEVAGGTMSLSKEFDEEFRKMGFTHGAICSTSESGVKEEGNLYNIICSKYPFSKPVIKKHFTVNPDPSIKNQNTEQRCFVGAQIKLPNNEIISVYGTHLEVRPITAAGGRTYSPEQARKAQLQELVEHIEQNDTNKNVVIGADFNGFRKQDLDAFAIKDRTLWEIMENNWQDLLKVMDIPAHLTKQADQKPPTLVGNYLNSEGYVDSFEKGGFTPPQFTTWTGTRIDFLMLRPTWNLPIKGTYVFYNWASDHIPVIMDVQL